MTPWPRKEAWHPLWLCPGLLWAMERAPCPEPFSSRTFRLSESWIRLGCQQLLRAMVLSGEGGRWELLLSPLHLSGCYGWWSLVFLLYLCIIPLEDGGGQPTDLCPRRKRKCIPLTLLSSVWVPMLGPVMGKNPDWGERKQT